MRNHIPRLLLILTAVGCGPAPVPDPGAFGLEWIQVSQGSSDAWQPAGWVHSFRIDYTGSKRELELFCETRVDEQLVETESLLTVPLLGLRDVDHGTHTTIEDKAPGESPRIRFSIHVLPLPELEGPENAFVNLTRWDPAEPRVARPTSRLFHLAARDSRGAFGSGPSTSFGYRERSEDEVVQVTEWSKRPGEDQDLPSVRTTIKLRLR